MAVANYDNDNYGCSWVSQEQIAEETELSVRTVIRALADLEEAGLISREHRYGKNGKRISDRIVLNNGTGLPDRLSPDTQSRDTGALPDTQSITTCQRVTANKEPLKEPLSSSSPTRVPPDFFPNENFRERIHRELEFSSERIEDERESMIEYFSSRTDAKSFHCNWQRVFWNWCKRSKNFERRDGQTTKPNSIKGGLAEIRARLEARIASEESAGSDGGGGETAQFVPRLRQGS